MVAYLFFVGDEYLLSCYWFEYLLSCYGFDYLLTCYEFEYLQVRFSFAGMAEGLIKTRIHHKGHFRGIPLRYVGGESIEIDGDVDLFCYFSIKSTVKGLLGYPDDEYKLWWSSEVNLAKGLKKILDDKDAMEVARYAMDTGGWLIYTWNILWNCLKLLGMRCKKKMLCWMMKMMCLWK